MFEAQLSENYAFEPSNGGDAKSADDCDRRMIPGPYGHRQKTAKSQQLHCGSHVAADVNTKSGSFKRLKISEMKHKSKGNEWRDGCEQDGERRTRSQRK